MEVFYGEDFSVYSQFYSGPNTNFSDRVKAAFVVFNDIKNNEQFSEPTIKIVAAMFRLDGKEITNLNRLLSISKGKATDYHTLVLNPNPIFDNSNWSWSPIASPKQGLTPDLNYSSGDATPTGVPESLTPTSPSGTSIELISSRLGEVLHSEM